MRAWSSFRSGIPASVSILRCRRWCSMPLPRPTHPLRVALAAPGRGGADQRHRARLARVGQRCSASAQDQTPHGHPRADNLAYRGAVLRAGVGLPELGPGLRAGRAVPLATGLADRNRRTGVVVVGPAQDATRRSDAHRLHRGILLSAAVVAICAGIIFMRGLESGFLPFFRNWPELYRAGLVDGAEWRAHRFEWF